MKKIFFNPHITSSHKVESAYRQQVTYLKRVWNEDSLGLERLLRLSICLIQFLYPLLLVREVSGRLGGVTLRKLAGEFYTLLKLAFPLLVLSLGLYRHHWVIVPIVYLLSETVIHLLSLIFLFDIEDASLSYRRGILLLLLNYLEVVLDFSVIYIGFSLLSQTLSPLSALYFSLVASTTVGFGDIHAQAGLGQAVVIAQLLICVCFIVLFINHFSQRK